MVTGHPKEPFCLPVTDVPVLHSFEARMQTLTRCVGPGRSLLQVSSEASCVANQSVKAAQAASDDGKVDRGRGGRSDCYDQKCSGCHRVAAPRGAWGLARSRAQCLEERDLLKTAQQ